jgi:hypothetical protein
MEYLSINHVVRYSRTCGSYPTFLDREPLLTRKLLDQGFLVVKLKPSLDRGPLLTRKLLDQGFLVVKLKSSLGMFYDRRHDRVSRYGF